VASPVLYLGVDGGATRCRGRLRDASGAVLAEAEGPAANAYVGFDTAVAVVRDVIARCLSDMKDTTCVSLGLGLAGISSPADSARFAAALPGFADVRVANDATTACLGAHAGADGGLLIAGTGSAGIARVAGREAIISGRGFLLGDDGSAARVGANALRAALRAHDGLQPHSALTRDIMAHFGDDPVAMTRWALTARPGDYGAFAPRVLEAAARGDVVALPIVEAATRAIGALAAAITALGAARIAMVGGLGAAIRPYLPPELNAQLREPLFDPTDGAVLLAGGKLPDVGKPAP